jgi:hypothetical protein
MSINALFAVEIGLILSNQGVWKMPPSEDRVFT